VGEPSGVKSFVFYGRLLGHRWDMTFSTKKERERERESTLESEKSTRLKNRFSVASLLEKKHPNETTLEGRNDCPSGLKQKDQANEKEFKTRINLFDDT